MINKLEFNELSVCAFRYAFGRRTYITSTIADILIKHKELLSRSSIEVIVRDIDKADEALCDAIVWLGLKKELLNG